MRPLDARDLFDPKGAGTARVFRGRHSSLGPDHLLHPHRAGSYLHSDAPERRTSLGRGAPALHRTVSRFLSDTSAYGSTWCHLVSARATPRQPDRVPRLWNTPHDPECALLGGVGSAGLSPRAGGRAGSAARLADRTCPRT